MSKPLADYLREIDLRDLLNHPPVKGNGRGG